MTTTPTPAPEIEALIERVEETAIGCDHMTEYGLRDMCNEAAATLRSQAARIKELEAERDEARQRLEKQKERFFLQVDFTGELQRLLWALAEGNPLPDTIKKSHAYTVASRVRARAETAEAQRDRLASELREMQETYVDLEGLARREREIAASRVERLRGALEPFSRHCDLNDLDERDENDALEIPVRDLRAARTALKETKPHAEQREIKRLREIVVELRACVTQPNTTDKTRWDIAPGMHRRFSALVARAAYEETKDGE